MTESIHPLAKWRADRGLTQGALAKQLKVAPNTVWRWENKDRQPRRKDIERIAEHTGLTASQILGMEEAAR